ncbi:ABC transporter substrate-binding protein [Pseudogemmobacter faecipullorum]|uniref:Extracellular solute-binding protein n=1 Tax=Pseudogemmobacter faecipullorum TaxID=2755041 RepID=A0ABS8CJ79_9RHOB|nr:extracellular solute-binding protein [Pseudogemmobacter faecipullorum]MCB5409462.1 extracellular solute-binding protein [Pseudogemmobacter faecipullorum]
MTTTEKKAGDFSRRGFLKASAGAAGAAAGAGVLGTPMIWAQTIKDITLNQVGPSYSVIADICEKASADLGFKIMPQTADSTSLMAKVVNQPETIDIADLEFWAMQKVWRSGQLQPVEVAKIAKWNDITPVMKDGKNFDGSPQSMQGTTPVKVMYTGGPGDKEFSAAPTEYATTMPTIFNADTLGIRPDLIGRPVDSWAELFNPEFRGKVALMNIPQIGIMDAAMAIEALGERTYADKGNMSKEEIDFTIDRLIGLKKEGHFRAFWTTFDESVNLMAGGEVVIQSMWSPAVTAVKSRGTACIYQGMKEGYRGWGLGMGLMSHLEGIRLEAAYEYLNWYLTGWQGAFIARQGYYSSVPSTAKENMTADEWGYWYEGKPAVADILDPYGAVMDKAGASRDGGSFEARIGNIACWNTVMDEERYMVSRWNEFVSA